MTKFEIKEKIDANNQIIESLLTPNRFTLNNTIAKLLEENDKLQAKCPHEFKDGYYRILKINSKIEGEEGYVEY